tara:strand:- start:4 stop:282 length:279 start_codon:yes stop_codon:yes gene_type:complete
MTEPRLVAIRIRGIVQGVFFRKTTQQKAVQLGITGTVKNKDDGSVYIEACGTPEALKALVEWCHEGPPRAEVESVETKDMEFKEFKDFSIKR